MAPDPITIVCGAFAARATHTMEAPARHKGGITSRRNYLCDTTQLFAS